MKCAFRWYATEAERTRHTIGCKEDAEVCPFAFLMPSTQILPFQILAGRGDTFGQSNPTSWVIKDLDGFTVHNLSAFLLDIEVEQFGNPDREYVILDDPLDHGLTIADGLYEMVIGTNGGNYYSETFRVCAADDNCTHTLTWRSCGDIGTQRYRYRSFTNYMLFPQVSNHLGKPESLITENTQGTSRGADNRVTALKEITWQLRMNTLPWYKIDAVTEIPLHSEIKLKAAGRSDYDTLMNVRTAYSWPEGEVCAVPYLDFAFKVDESVFVSSCCDGFDSPCTEPCVVADGVWPDDELVIDDIYLLANGRAGVYYGLDAEVPVDVNGFGSFVGCPGRLATLTGTGAVHYTGGAWVPALTLDTLEVGAVPGDVILTGSSMPQYGVSVQWSVDGGTWTTIGPVFTSDQIASGARVTTPIEARFFRLQLVGDGCTLATSDPLEYGYAEPFGCTGNGYATYTQYETGFASYTSSTGEATFRGPDLVLAVDSSGLFECSTGVWCMAATDEGDVIGSLTDVNLAFVSSFDVTGLTAVEAVSAQGTFFTVDLTAQVLMDYLDLASPFLRTVDITNSPLIRQVGITAPLINFYFVSILGFESINIIGGSLDEATVDAAFNALDPTVTGFNSSIVGGTNAAPSAASLTNRNAYIANGNTITTN